MGFYEERIFPWMNDMMMADPKLVAFKRTLLAAAKGRVIEIGIGSGLNLELYPSAVEAVVGIDPNAGMNRRAAKRIGQVSFPVTLEGLSGESLPFPDASFDTAVSTMVVCSIPDAARALREVRRVLKPEGRFLFLEHGKHDDPKIATWQRRLNPIQRVLACGCELDRDVPELLRSAGLKVGAMKTFQAQGVPRTHGYIFMGDAGA